MKTFISANIFDIYTRMEVLLRLKLSGHTDNLAEASNLIVEVFKSVETENKQQYGNAPDKFRTI